MWCFVFGVHTVIIMSLVFESFFGVVLNLCEESITDEPSVSIFSFYFIFDVNPRHSDKVVFFNLRASSLVRTGFLGSHIVFVFSRSSF